MRIRRYLRDPDANIWDTDTLRELWNQAQAQLARELPLLKDVRVLPVPPRYQGSYMFTWEWASRGQGTRHYRCLFQAGGQFVCTGTWEVQEFAGVASDADDIGYGYTHPWESFAALGNQPTPVPFLDDVSGTIGVYWDGEPLDLTTRRRVQQTDPTWRSRAGEPFAYYSDGDLENQIVVYPRPSSVTWNDESGAGWVTSVSGDTTGSDEGIITQRTGNVLSAEQGVAVDALDTAENLTVLYDVSPRRVEALGDELDLPAYLWKYVRYRVLQLAHESNTDGRIPSVARFWGLRYRAGVKALKRFRVKRSEDRTYVLSTRRGARRSVPRHPRLPDAYPPV